MRNKNDLLYRHKISLQDALLCKPVCIPLLNGRSLMLPLDKTVSPQTLMKIECEGMPIYDKKDYLDQNLKRGNLFIQFEIEFPSKLSTAQKNRLLPLLG
jgi:DnaJ-class molecular chaperone